MKKDSGIIRKVLSLIVLTLALPVLVNGQLLEDVLLWKFNSGALNNAPLVCDTVLYFGSMDANFYAINTNTGAEIWHYKTAYPITSNAAIKDNVVCVESGNRLYGFESKTGNLLWSYLASTKLPTLGHVTDYHHSSPVIYNNKAYFGDEWGNINGVDIQTGSLVFQYTIKAAYTKASDFNIRSTPAIKDDIIYFGDFGANVYAISLKDGSEKWIHKMTPLKWDGSIVSEMIIKDNVLYFGSYNNVFSPLNIKSGNQIWSFSEPYTYLPSTPVFFEDKVIMGSTIKSDSIHCLKVKDGKELWSIKAKGIFFVKPIIIQDSILVIKSTNPFEDGIGVLYFINCKAGNIISQLDITMSTESSPIIMGNKLFIGRKDGMYAIDYKPFLLKIYPIDSKLKDKLK